MGGGGVRQSGVHAGVRSLRALRQTSRAGYDHRMLLEELRARRHEVAALGRRYGARRIRVFGSVARGDETPESDIDFLVDFPAGYDLFAQRMPLADALAKLFVRTVDVVPEHELSRHIRGRVLEEAVDL
ncbi:MAG: hypothetical protein AMXMBFR78_31560 [Rubrivivax sp.]